MTLPIFIYLVAFEIFLLEITIVRKRRNRSAAHKTLRKPLDYPLYYEDTKKKH